jgi:AcrR family transcriptional regulator
VQKLSIEAIAKRAGVGKTTIYRRWPSKAAVVIDAFVEHHLVHTPIREDLPVRAAMTEHLTALAEQYSGPQGRLVAQIIAKSQYDESALHEFRERFWDGRRAATRALIERGICEGDLGDDLDPRSHRLDRLLIGLRPAALRPRQAGPRGRRVDRRDGHGRRRGAGRRLALKIARLSVGSTGHSRESRRR